MESLKSETNIKLLTETKLGYDCTITGNILLVQVCQQATTMTNHLQKTAAGMMILLVGLQMFGECSNAFRKNRNLYFRRTGVAFVAGIIFDNCLLFFCC